MKRLLQMLSLFLVMALLGSLAAGYESAQATGDPVDSLTGDGGFNSFFPMTLSDPSVQKAQYSEGLLQVIELLERRDLSDMPPALREQRARNIECLRKYRMRGIFPVNYERPGELLPCFIDSTGAICAAGYLVEHSAGRDVAEAIDREYRYASIAEIDSPALDRWIASSGLTRAEVATIQRPSISSSGRVRMERPPSARLSASPSLPSSGSRDRPTAARDSSHTTAADSLQSE